MIKEVVAEEVEEEMAGWGSQPNVSAFVNSLRKIVQENDELCKPTEIQLDNS